MQTIFTGEVALIGDLKASVARVTTEVLRRAYRGQERPENFALPHGVMVRHTVAVTWPQVQEELPDAAEGSRLQ